MKQRGFAAIALENPKFGVNVGSTLRAAYVFDADLVVIGGGQVFSNREMATDTAKAWRHIPVIHTPNVLDCRPFGSKLVAIELGKDATLLSDFVHPQAAMYVFGRENNSISPEIMEQCDEHVVVETVHGCMNVAVTVNLILYHRHLQMARRSNDL